MSDWLIAATAELADALIDTSPLPSHPDRHAVNTWLVSAHQRAWAESSA